MSFDKEFDEGKEIVFRIPDIDYVLVHWERNKCTPWVAAWGYNEEGKYWSQGHYFQTLKSAIEYLIDVIEERMPKYYERRYNQLISELLELCKEI